MMKLPDHDDVLRASQRIAGSVRCTPLLESSRLNQMTGGRMLLKAECLQETGSFKFRGATNALLLLSDDERRAGVVAYSSGNHALAISSSAKALGIPAVVVMPGDAPRSKVNGTRAAGAEIIFYDRLRDDRIAICARLVTERSLTLVPPYDHKAVIAGQGTLALEAVHQASDLGAHFDTMLASCSGGGLAAGCALVIRAHSPQAMILVVEPEGFDDTGRSLESGQECCNEAMSGSICDALLVPKPGILTLPILRRMGARGRRVADAEVSKAMKFALEELKLVIEPGGAAALAAAMHSGDLSGRTALVVLSGGNVDSELLSNVISREESCHA